MKKNTTKRQAERRKPIKNEQIAKHSRAIVRARQNTHDRLSASYDSIIGLHEVAVDQLTHVTTVSALVTHPDVKEYITPEVEKELAKSLKVVIDGVREDEKELRELTTTLNSMRPDPKNILRGDEAVDRNSELLSLGGRYGTLIERHETVTVPATRTCIDLINSIMPDDKKVSIETFDADLTAAASTTSIPTEEQEVNVN